MPTSTSMTRAATDTTSMPAPRSSAPTLRLMTISSPMTIATMPWARKSGPMVGMSRYGNCCLPHKYRWMYPE